MIINIILMAEILLIHLTRMTTKSKMKSQNVQNNYRN